MGANLARPHHAYLFVGPPHVGKTTGAIAFAQALNCPDHGCLECVECRSIAHANHPDVRVIQASEGKKVFSVEDVRKLIEEVGWKSFRARHKVYVIPTELLNVQGANTLLKTLEEPQPGTVLILVAKSVDEVLPTLVSRCQTVPFGPVPPPRIEAWLIEERGLDPARARHLARIADGRLGWAGAIAESGELPIPQLLGAESYPAALVEADRLAGEDQEGQLVALEALIAQVRDIMVSQQTGRADWLARPEQAEPSALSGLPLAYWLRVAKRLEEARHQLLAHANGKLLWTVLAGAIQPTARERATPPARA